MARDSHPTAKVEAPAFGERRFGPVNWLGLWTLFKKEVMRYLKVAAQTVFAPIITTMLYLTVFLVAFGAGRETEMEGQLIAFAAFLPPGLIMMAVLSNAFQNASSSLIIGKVQGSVVDVLMPPLSAAELTVAFVMGAAVRGLMVGLVTAFTIGIFMALTGGPIPIHNVAAILYFALCASIMLGAIGAIAGMWAEKFDQLALITNFVITPLTFLSGTFYSVKREGIPAWVADISAFNPLFYLIDGFRYGFIGVSDAPVSRGAVISLALSAAACGVTYVLFKRGYKLKA
ncbi:ABC transporter permease [Parvularcula sp. ZS-1/3]|uniref:Transport permease protein n=1 Tax=Parvularcula mediterranea TaxID=2732508 RepID=A0A7Y3RLU7_9PROT|nr:ABC transporter permease [Parvularcula mediterranea]NNU16486.1 ABC transporter permease [Parvularcula mediterranea]